MAGSQGIRAAGSTCPPAVSLASDDAMAANPSTSQATEKTRNILNSPLDWADSSFCTTSERAETRNRYRVDGLILMKAERHLEATGLEIIGYYHSHPDHPAQYSDYDREHALPNMSYVICSVLEGRADKTLSWVLQEDRASMNPQIIDIEG